MAALSGVMFFCGMLSAIFSLFAACSATLLLTENYFERRRVGTIYKFTYIFWVRTYHYTTMALYS